MTENDVRDLLSAECRKAGNQRRWADRHRLSPSYVSDVIKGARNPADAILAALGVRRVVTYERIV
jgi:hypothetical protein